MVSAAPEHLNRIGQVKSKGKSSQIISFITLCRSLLLIKHEPCAQLLPQYLTDTLSQCRPLAQHPPQHKLRRMSIRAGWLQGVKNTAAASVLLPPHAMTRSKSPNGSTTSLAPAASVSSARRGCRPMLQAASPITQRQHPPGGACSRGAHARSLHSGG